MLNPEDIETRFQLFRLILKNRLHCPCEFYTQPAAGT